MMYGVNRTVCWVAGVLVVAALGLSTGCDGSPGTGTLTVLVTDAPFPFQFVEEAIVTIERVDVHRIGGVTDPNDPNDPNDGDGDGAWITIVDTPQQFDLMDLQDGRTDLLASAVIDAGTYNQMRLVVTDGSVLLTDGRPFDLRVPSGSQSGIKLHFTFEVLADDETSLLVDVDLARAFRPVPGSGVTNVDDIEQFQFTPSLAMRVIDIVEAGSITGTVTDESDTPMEGVTVTAKDGDVEIAYAATQTDGTYTVSGLTAGTYTVVFSAEGYVTVEVPDVVVVAGETTEEVDAEMVAEPAP